jgi:hypothetical protein
MKLIYKYKQHTRSKCGSQNSLCVIICHFLHSSTSDNKGFLLQILIPEPAPASVLIPPPISELLSTYHQVFAEPKGLPPPRSHDHQILLKASQPVTVRLYRYPYFQKTKIEKIVRELLASGVIQPSQSPFSSPVLLVRKADGSWRLCVDY